METIPSPCGGCTGCAGRAGCASACGGCAGCGGCPGAGTLYLTEAEVDLLRRFGEIPFWPLVRRAGAEDPECPEEGMGGPGLRGLSSKGLIRLDEDLPLTNYDYGDAPSGAHRGSCALTAAGQRALELLEIQGAG